MALKSSIGKPWFRYFLVWNSFDSHLQRPSWKTVQPQLLFRTKLVGQLFERSKNINVVPFHVTDETVKCKACFANCWLSCIFQVHSHKMPVLSINSELCYITRYILPICSDFGSSFSKQLIYFYVINLKAFLQSLFTTQQFWNQIQENEVCLILGILVNIYFQNSCWMLCRSFSKQ